MLYVRTSSSYETYLIDKTETSTKANKNYKKLKENTAQNQANHVETEFNMNKKGSLLYKRILYIPHSKEINNYE